MKNYDKLICLFESEGLNVETYYNQKKEYIIGNKARMNFVTSKDTRIGREFLKKQQSYASLCDFVGKFLKAEEAIYDKYPNNPFLYDYHNKFILEQPVSSCTYVLDGQKMNLESIDKSDVAEPVKDEVFGEVVDSWSNEVDQYLVERKSKVLDYVETEYFIKNNKIRKVRISLTELISKIIIICLLFCISLSVFAFDFSFLSAILADSYSGALAFSMACFLTLATVMEFILFSKSRNRILDKIGARYDYLIDKCRLNVHRLSRKEITSTTQLKNFFNYRKAGDRIDFPYITENGITPFQREYRILKNLFLILSAIAFILGIFAFEFWFLLVTVIGLYVLSLFRIY